MESIDPTSYSALIAAGHDAITAIGKENFWSYDKKLRSVLKKHRRAEEAKTMSVVLTPSCFEHPHPGGDPRCAMCNSRLHPPFIVWRSEALLYICGDCGQSYAQGLMADLIHLKAIKDLKRLYPAFTLERHDQARLQARQWRDKKLEEING